MRELRARLRRLAAEARAETGREPELASLASAAGVSDGRRPKPRWRGSSRSTATAPPRSGLGRSEQRADLEVRFRALDERERELVVSASSPT